MLKSLFGKKSESPRAASDKPADLAEAAPVGVSTPAASTAHNPKEPIAAVHLEQAMVEAARANTPENRARVYQELLFSDLLLALADTEPQAEGNSEDKSASVAILQNPQGMHFAAAFTSAAAARSWRENGNYLSIRGQELFKMLEPSPAEVIVVNPGSAPFVVLPKVEVRQLALGFVPNSNRNPVQVQKAEAADEDQVQFAFPPDVFSDEQKAHAKAFLEAHPNVEAAVIGAVRPPKAPENAWVRTLFIRVTGIEVTPEAMQGFSQTVRTELVSGQAGLFENFAFEVGVMPDPQFWVAMNQNGIVLFDRNPPAPQEEASSESDGQMQVAFPPDVMTDAQKDFAREVLMGMPNVEAAVIGAIRPPDAPENNWMRTIFIRVQGIAENQDAMQGFCVQARDAIRAKAELFADVNFEVGVMPDPGFWGTMNQNGLVLFDRNPEAFQKDGASGVVDANLG